MSCHGCASSLRPLRRRAKEWAKAWPLAVSKCFEALCRIRLMPRDLTEFMALPDTTCIWCVPACMQIPGAIPVVWELRSSQGPELEAVVFSADALPGPASCSFPRPSPAARPLNRVSLRVKPWAPRMGSQSRSPYALNMNRWFEKHVLYIYIYIYLLYSCPGALL